MSSFNIDFIFYLDCLVSADNNVTKRINPANILNATHRLTTIPNGANTHVNPIVVIDKRKIAIANKLKKSLIFCFIIIPTFLIYLF